MHILTDELQWLALSLIQSDLDDAIFRKLISGCSKHVLEKNRPSLQGIDYSSLIAQKIFIKV